MRSMRQLLTVNLSQLFLRDKLNDGVWDIFEELAADVKLIGPMTKMCMYAVQWAIIKHQLLHSINGCGN